MNKAVNQLRLLLCTFSGEDDFIIRKCPKEIQLSFASIGLFVILIFIGCFLSATTFTYSLFEENPFISTPFGIFWAFMIIIIYLLLLYTITPPILPNNYKKKKNKYASIENNSPNQFFTLSMFLRMGFMLLLAIIIAQPLNVYILSKSTESSIEKFKHEQKAKMIIVSDSLLIQNEIALRKDFETKINLKIRTNNVALVEKEFMDVKITSDEIFVANAFRVLDSINKIDEISFLSKKNKTTRDSLIVELSTLVENEIQSDYDFKQDIETATFNNKDLKEDLEIYKNGLIQVINSKIDNYEKLDTLLNKSNFYLQKISILLRENPISWIITLIVCLFFLLPIYLKFIIRNKTGYYEIREKLERRIVIDAYNDFKNHYSKILSTKVAEFNTKHKKELHQFLSKIKNLNPDKFNQLVVEIDEEYKDEPISKYEHWSDCPFKTQKKLSESSISNDEKALLKLLYPNSEE
jgi:hypothetical protein